MSVGDFTIKDSKNFLFFIIFLLSSFLISSKLLLSQRQDRGKIEFGAAQNDFALLQDAAYVEYLFLFSCLVVSDIYYTKTLVLFFVGDEYLSGVQGLGS